MGLYGNTVTASPAPVPDATPERMGAFNIKAPRSLVDALRAAANDEGVSASAWTRTQLEMALAELDGTVVRVPLTPSVARMLKAAVASAGCGRSEFAAEAVEAASRRELEAAARVRTDPTTTVEHFRCSHPRPARRQIVNRIECAACGKTLRTF